MTHRFHPFVLFVEPPRSHATADHASLPLVFPKPVVPQMPPLDDSLAFATVADLGRMLREKRFSSEQLTEFFLRRLETVGARLNGVVTVLREPALAEARKVDAERQAGIDRGPLHGIPYGAKDLIAARGAPTTWGAAPFRNRVIDQDATVVVKLRQAGAVLAAKVGMVELAGGMGYRQANASLTGAGLNPWNPSTWAGGSSSGSGSVVGGGCVPFAIGSETWGSILTPAGYCGIAGLRPTYGRVSRHGAMALSWTMDKLGPMCRTAHDCGLVLHAIAGADPHDDTSVDKPFRYPAETPRKTFRVALLKDPRMRVQPEVQANFQASLDVLRGFCDFTEREVPDMPYAVAASTIIAAEGATAFQDLIATGETWQLTAPEDRVGAFAGQWLPATDYINAFRVRKKTQGVAKTLFAELDAIAIPTLPSVAPPIAGQFRDHSGGYSGSILGAIGNLAGLPALAVINGFGERQLPTSLCLVGPAWGELALLEIAHQYESKTQHHLRHPAL